MEQIGRLQKQWREQGRFRGLHASMCLEKDGVVLGAKTLLAKRKPDGALALDGAEARILTLLAVAYGKPADASVLGMFRRASRHAQTGDEAMAAMHIALARLPRLTDASNAAKRLFIADGLLADGIAPRDIWMALEFDPAPLDALEKYDPSEPRNPSGDGRASGEWTHGGALSPALVPVTPAARRWLAEDAARQAEAAARNTARSLPELAEEEAEQTLEIGADGVLGVGIAAALIAAGVGSIVYFGSTENAGTAPIEGQIPGRPDLRFTWTVDEGTLRIYRGADPYPIEEATSGPKGSLVDQRGRKIAYLLEAGIRFEMKALPPEWPSPEERKQRPQLCPDPGPDNPGAKPTDRDYEDYVKARINKPPTPRGMGYWLMNPVDEVPVVVDDCQHTTGMLVEIKGNYKGVLSFPEGREGLEIDWAYQATRQWEASEGRPMEWDFKDKEAAEFAESIFQEHEWLERIHVVWTPWLRDEK